ncbi:MAG: B12-binding domain-containing radical SAM protein [Deltaproteobacteria bacterium]|nr:B12-binding domain-containing radical SAM protein [Deltaproteobacteria bacterium]
MRVLFIQNNGIQESIGVANLAGIIKAHGHECDLLLVSHTPDLLGAIERYDPGLIAFSALTGVHQSLIELAREIKARCRIPIIMGGPHPTYSPDVVQEPSIDIVCRGEGELAFLELVERMEAGRDITDIRNLYVKTRDGVIHKNELRPPVPLDELPFPDRELYYKYAFLKNVPMKRFIASMGCPYPCTFCHEPVIRSMYRGKGNYVRRKSVPRTIAEIRYIRDRYLLRHVHFSDDLFFIRNSYEWLEEFAEAYAKEIGLPFCCNLRYDSINEHAATLLTKAKCFGVAVGLESGNEQLREVVIQKRVKNAHMVDGARLLRERGIKMLTTNMLGLPGETLDQAFETVELNMRLGTNYARANTFLLFPGLPMVDYARRNGFVDPNFDIDKHVAESTEINLITPYAKEFRNLAALFWVFVKFSPRWIPFFKRIVKLPDNLLFRFIGACNMIQELLFYRIRPIAGWRFFRNTVLASKRSGISMTLRSIPSLLKRKTPSIVTNRPIYENDRGYF